MWVQFTTYAYTTNERQTTVQIDGPAAQPGPQALLIQTIIALSHNSGLQYRIYLLILNSN